ncbi:MAG: type VI secretion protein IcmF/TssM N-terminal domain-containing protein, partial [Burkholderiaceae bacterium]
MSNLSFFWLFLIIFISLIIFSLSIFFSLKKQEKKADFTLSKKKIREIFKKGVRASERTLLPGSKKYDYPWIILLNEGKEDDRIPIESINLMRSRASKNLDVSKSFFWHYFSKGLVLEFSSSALREEDESVKEDIKWTEFLKLCNQYRPRRPIDSIVVSVPAKLLSKSASDKSAKVQLLNLAKAASQRIWMVQNSFSVRVPVYLIISGCEDIPGFESFSKSLPESMRDSILGWSNPNDLSSTFLKEWVVQAINGISETVASLVVDVATSTKKKKNRVSEFLLPIEIKHLQAGMMDYTEALVESSGFYEPFFFRGIYMVTNHEKPSFCKDLFEKKIIGELGLLRPSNNQRFKISDPNKFLKWIFLSFISIWSIGLVFSAVKGHQIVTRLT